MNRVQSKYKILLSFLLIIVLFVFSGIITINGLFKLGDLTRMIYNHPLVVSNASLVAALNITKMHRSMKDFVLANSQDEEETALKSVSENEYIVYQNLDIVRDTILGRDGELLEKQTREFFMNWKPIREEVVKLFQSGEKKEAVMITKGKGAEYVKSLEARMIKLTSYARNKADLFLLRASTSQTKLEKITIYMTIAGILLSILIAFIATYFILKAEKILKEEKMKLQKAMDEIKTLQGIIPICSHCKQIKDGEGMWNKVEEYIDTHTEAQFSHGICPDCWGKYYSKDYPSIDPDEK